MPKNKKYALIGFIGGLAVAFLGCGLWKMTTAGTAMNVNATAAAPGSRTAQRKVTDIERLIHENYLYEVDGAQLSEKMYAGLVAGVDDPYSCYYTKDEYEIVNETTEGHYQGIGVVMIQEKDSGVVTVAHCYEGSPAQNVGILDGDIIHRVDGEEVAGKMLSEVAALIRTPESDPIAITLIREGQESYIEVEVTRTTIEIPVVDHKMLDHQIGYVAIHQFTATTASQFEEAMQELTSQKMERLIVDLRDNPGGLLSGVCDTLNSFMPAGLLVYTEDKYGNRTEYVGAGEHPLEIPLVVLINENSASASEIFAGAVKDHQVGTLVGTTTYGKGIVQKLFSLDDGSVVKLTISSYYSPKGVNIHGQGIAPDITVAEEETAAGEETEKVDKQLDKAIEVVNDK